jgi:hypothetical protein
MVLATQLLGTPTADAVSQAVTWGEPAQTKARGMGLAGVASCGRIGLRGKACSTARLRRNLVQGRCHVT